MSAVRSILRGIAADGRERRKQDGGLWVACGRRFPWAVEDAYNRPVPGRRPGGAASVDTLTELREWNLAHEQAGALKYGQAGLDGADEMDLEAARAEYEADRARDLRLNGEHGIDEVMTRLELDALLFPASSGAGISARPGYPTVIVPYAFVATESDPPMPEGFEPKPRPFGVSFAGMTCSEPRLIELAYAFEQATMRRIPPRACGSSEAKKVSSIERVGAPQQLVKSG